MSELTERKGDRRKVNRAASLPRHRLCFRQHCVRIDKTCCVAARDRDTDSKVDGNRAA